MEKNSLEAQLGDALKIIYGIYYKTQNYHWNVEGPNFISLHQLFEEQYDALKDQIDDLAELIRGLDQKVTFSLKDIAEADAIGPVKVEACAQEMLNDLVADYTVAEKAFAAIVEAAAERNDEVVTGFASEALTAYRKTKWMLKSSAA